MSAFEVRVDVSGEAVAKEYTMSSDSTVYA